MWRPTKDQVITDLNQLHTGDIRLIRRADGKLFFVAAIPFQHRAPEEWWQHVALSLLIIAEGVVSCQMILASVQLQALNSPNWAIQKMLELDVMYMLIPAALFTVGLSLIILRDSVRDQRKKSKAEAETKAATA